MTALEIKILAGLALVAALLLGLHFYDARQQKIGKQDLELAIEQQHTKDVAVADARNAEIHTAQEASDHEADRFHLAATLDARDAVDADRRLQQRFAAVNARCVPGDSAASAPGQTTDDAAGVRSDVLRRVVAAARLAASAADDAHGAGLNAEQHYDALSPK